MKDSGTKIEKKSSSFDFIIECRLHYAVAKNATETPIENAKIATKIELSTVTNYDGYWGKVVHRRMQHGHIQSNTEVSY